MDPHYSLRNQWRGADSGERHSQWTEQRFSDDAEAVRDPSSGGTGRYSQNNRYGLAQHPSSNGRLVKAFVGVPTQIELFSKAFPQETHKGHHFFGRGLSHA